MQICIAFLLVGAGFTLYAIHSRICSKRECAAYNNGYMQAQKENKIRLEAVEQFKATLPKPRPITPPGVEEQHTMLEGVKRFEIPPEFWGEVRKNGRAVVRVK